MIIEKEYLIGLYDIYSGLLTEKQREYFEMYYFQDYSLGEIANYLNITRNAIFDQIKKASKQLEHFEEILSLKKKEEERNKIIDQYELTYNIDLEKLKNL